MIFKKKKIGIFEDRYIYKYYFDTYEFEDPSKIKVSLGNVYKGFSTQLESDYSFETEFFENFSSDLPLFIDGVANSKDELPWVLLLYGRVLTTQQ